MRYDGIGTLCFHEKVFLSPVCTGEADSSALMRHVAHAGTVTFASYVICSSQATRTSARREGNEQDF